MKIFSSKQVKEWDACTLAEQQISSDALMEKAAGACFDWIIKNNFNNSPVKVFCGNGNNGGDGLALARMLFESGSILTVYIIKQEKEGSVDFRLNLQRLRQVAGNIITVSHSGDIPLIEKDELVIDALFGTGLNKPLEGIAMMVAEHINASGATVISIDIPSGLFCDRSSKGNTVVHATHTLSFQSVKLAFLMPENDLCVGAFHILDIGLSVQFEKNESTRFEITDHASIQAILRPRNKFAHKGNFGHAALIAGSQGMMGAAVLAAKACLYSGTGKLTCIIPSCGYEIMQTAVPEAMCRIAGEKMITKMEKTAPFDAIGIGPGLGTSTETSAAFHQFLAEAGKQCVLDADALNMLANDQSLRQHLPEGSVLTPHIKEFERLFGTATDDFNRMDIALKQANQLNIFIVLKGHYTIIFTPSGKVYFNSTGNPGMAKGGMGDVLTGMLTGFLAQQYPLPDAAILATYIHGLAGDLAAVRFTPQAMQASDLVNCIGDAWKKME